MKGSFEIALLCAGIAACHAGAAAGGSEAKDPATARNVAASSPPASAPKSAKPAPPSDDADEDGVPDATDLCPGYVEDLDGWEDDDGCPDPDNDKDLIPDTLDACPNEPETYNGYIDEDGCPDKGGRHERFGWILFENGRSEVRPGFHPVLDELARDLRELFERKPDAVLLVEADATSAEPDRLRLIDARAQAVRRLLMERGVDARRLIATSGRNDSSECLHSEPRSPQLRDEGTDPCRRSVRFAIQAAANRP